MKVNFIAIFAVAMLGWSTLPVCEAGTGVQPPSTGDKKTREEFYRVLEAVQTDSAAAQLGALQRFLEGHAEFEPIYPKLLERFLFYDQIIAAKTYFQQLAANPQYRRNSYWMLAKILMLENDPVAAFNAFTQALLAGSPSLPLLKDFIEFDHQHFGKFDAATLLRENELNRATQKVISAFSSYYKLAYKQAVQIFTEVLLSVSHDPVVLHVWGECFYRLVRYNQADSIWHIGLSNARKNGDREAEAQFLSNLGFLKYASRDHNLALTYFDSASTIADQTDDLFRLQWLAGHCAYIYRDRGEHDEAIKLFKEAIRIGSKIGVHRYLADWNRGYAGTLYYLGQYDEAIKAIDEGENHARKSYNEERLVMIKYDKGTFYITLKQYALARRVFEEAYELAKSKKMTYHQYYVKYKLGEIMLLEKKYITAREYYLEFINFLNKNNLRKLACECMGRFAKTYLLEKRYDLAKIEYLRAYEAAKEAGLKTFEGWYLLRVADIEVILGDIDSAMQKYNLVREIALQEKITEMLWELYLGYGNAYKKAGDLTAAIGAYTRAANIIEASRKDLKAEQLRIGYFIEGQQVYQNLVHCFLQRYEQNGQRADLDSLFYYEAMGRGRALQDLQRREGAFSQSEEYLQAQQQLRSLQRRLRNEAKKVRPPEEWDELLSQLEAARYSLITQRLRLAEKDSSSGTKQRYQPPPLQDVLAELKHAERGLLLYHISEEISFVLAAAGDEVKVVRLQVSPSKLASTVDSLMTPFHAVKEGSVEYTPFRGVIAHRLYKALVKPVEEFMALPPQLVIVPDLALMNLPFEMLLVAPPDTSEDYTPLDFPSYADQFLAQRYAFVYSPSASLLLARSKAVSPNSPVLVFANPFGSESSPAQKQNQLRFRTGWRFDLLPFSEVEANRIRETQPRAQVRKREHATKAAFVQEAPEHQVVHVASHAFVDTTFDAFSGLVLAAGNDSTDDGILMGYEISDLKLKCDLVTLSACETGQGQLVTGEGILGLPRLFLGAGAKTVLMTLWKVDDKFASDLMPRFYDYFLAQGLSKTEALNRAKRALLQQKKPENGVYHQHPFYWAAFALYGDPGIRRAPRSYALELTLVVVVILGLIGTFAFRHARQRRSSL
ncbi:CHAT domain-containing protein [candidate division KSB1 bacterium]|nr:CHAT domain-containing protein [candidate division KSB1 bacterium]